MAGKLTATIAKPQSLSHRLGSESQDFCGWIGAGGQEPLDETRLPREDAEMKRRAKAQTQRWCAEIQRLCAANKGVPNSLAVNTRATRENDFVQSNHMRNQQLGDGRLMVPESQMQR